MTGMALHVRSKGFCIFPLVCLAQHPLYSLHYHGEQLQPSHLTDIARHHGAVHSLQVCLYLESCQLFIRDLLEGLIQQVHPLLLHVTAQTLTKVVQRTQIKISCAKLIVP